MESLAVKILLIIMTAVCTVVGALLIWIGQKLLSTLFDTREEMIQTREQMKGFRGAIEEIPKLKKDLDALHAWKRERFISSPDKIES